MAGITAFCSIGNSLVDVLEAAWTDAEDPEAPDTELVTPKIQLISTGMLADDTAPIADGITLLLYRVTVSEQLRNHRREERVPGPLPVDLHYLLTVWTASAEQELVWMAWAMRTLHEHPLFYVPSYDEDGTRSEGEDQRVSLIPEELSNEDLLRLWDSFAPSYRLSYSYVARTVDLDGPATPTGKRVVVRRVAVEEDG